MKRFRQSKEAFPGLTIYSPLFIARERCHWRAAAIYNFTVRGDAEYQAELKVTGKEVIRTNVGSFPTIATQIKINSSANQKHQGQL